MPETNATTDQEDKNPDQTTNKHLVNRKLLGCLLPNLIK
jgi:hypothetical protein